jgi:hypothetical protein
VEAYGSGIFVYMKYFKLEYKFAGHVARMGEKRNGYRLLVRRPEGKKPLGRPRRRWIILGWILKRWDGVMLTGLVWLRIGIGGEVL